MKPARAIVPAVIVGLLIAGVALPAVIPKAWGSRDAKTYHTRDACNYSRRIKPENRVTFQTTEVAEKAGRTKCSRCTTLETKRP